MRSLIAKAVRGIDLSEIETTRAVDSMLSGTATETQVAALLTALSIKGESATEIWGAARALRKHAVLVKTDSGPTVLDTCGTGGDGRGTFNISTTVAFVLAAAGLRVAKHGNRAVSSACGSADVLEELGIAVDLSPERTAECIANVGVGFLYAPMLHPAMKQVAQVRKDIGLPTLFNIVGPLANPGGVRRQIIGVFRESLTNPVAHVLGRLGAERAMVVHGSDGLDEITISGPTFVSELRDGLVDDYTVAPEDFGIPRASLDCLSGGSATRNARLVEGVLQGEMGPRRDVVLLNAAAALTVTDVCDGFRNGIDIAAAAIDSGRAYQKLVCLRETTRA